MGHHHFFLGILVGFISVRVLFRLARGAFFVRRALFFRRRPDGGGGADAWRGRRWGAPGNAPEPEVVSEPIGARLERRLTALELNKMQRAEFDEVFARVRQVLAGAFDRWAGFDAAWAAIVATSFERAPVEAAFAAIPDERVRKELADGIEHLHNILTDEQRGIRA